MVNGNYREYCKLSGHYNRAQNQNKLFEVNKTTGEVELNTGITTMASDKNTLRFNYKVKESEV